MLNDRTKRLWIPGLTALLGAIGLCLIRFYTFGFRIFWLGGPVEVNFPCLCGLPFLGAAGAYWSGKQGGSRVMQAAAGLFPVLLFIATFCFQQTQWVIFRDPLPVYIYPANNSFVWSVLNWVIIPATVLLLGVLPFLRSSADSVAGDLAKH